jgi:F0F1-type ATP synthase assembly protein I
MPDNKKNGQVPWWQPGLILFSRLSGWIGGPILVAIFVGKYLDKKYDTQPWFFLLSVGIAFAVSTFGIIRDSLQEMKRIEKEEQAKNKIKDKKNGDF